MLPAAETLSGKYREALSQLAGNISLVHGFDRPVLTEGGDYPGIWLECGPMEGLLYGRYSPEIAVANHDVFFEAQHEDGYLPCWVRRDRVGSAQIQMVVPIAATALETAERYGNEAFLARAYQACSHWDAWLVRYRNTRGTGLCELFCEFDSGHDNSPRLAGIPKKCPDDDARVCPSQGRLPYLAPDLSASVYGGRVALSRMATKLGKMAEAQRWLEDAEAIRAALLEHCYCAEDECFYDVDAGGKFVRVRGDALTRVLGEHVVDQELFECIYARHIHNPAAFWTPYPLPSISAEDPAFVHSLPPNSWGGASQALTALRAARWFDHYGKTADLLLLMKKWVEAILRTPEFMQQIDPWTGEASTSAGYSPAMLVLTTFLERLETA